MSHHFLETPTSAGRIVLPRSWYPIFWTSSTVLKSTLGLGIWKRASCLLGSNFSLRGLTGSSPWRLNTCSNWFSVNFRPWNKRNLVYKDLRPISQKVGSWAICSPNLLWRHFKWKLTQMSIEFAVCRCPTFLTNNFFCYSLVIEHTSLIEGMTFWLLFIIGQVWMIFFLSVFLRNFLLW